MKTKTIRILVPVAVGVLVAVGYVVNTGIGNLSSLGWGGISLLCPLGALTTMLASKLLMPRALVSLVVAALLILAFGRLFCGWVCPVPVINKLPRLFRRRDEGDGHEQQPARAHSCLDCSENAGRVLDSRHLVLGGALLSATVFGFPVFCLVCPIGLAFATIFLVISLFAGGDVTWSVIVVPAVLLLEVTVFKRWCGRMCPLGALMSLLGRVSSRTLRPTVDASACVEGGCTTCGRCSAACEVGIDPRHPERGVSLSECVKCHECVEACPSHAIMMPLISLGAERGSGSKPTGEA